jgi:hypothetical protein
MALTSREIGLLIGFAVSATDVVILFHLPDSLLRSDAHVRKHGHGRGERETSSAKAIIVSIASNPPEDIEKC